MSDDAAISAVMAQCSVVVSLLGPSISDRSVGPTMYPELYKSIVFPMMRRHGVRRIFAMGTLTIRQPEDRWTLMQTAVVPLMRLFANSLYQNIIGVGNVFTQDASDLDWTIFRIAGIPGEADEVSWKKNRDGGKVFAGAIGEPGWTSSINRALLARWLCDSAESGAAEWIGKMPALAGK